MRLTAPEKRGQHHCVTAFDCGKTSLNQWLISRALPAQLSGSAATYVVLKNQIIVGYYSLTVGQVNIDEVSKRIGQGMGKYPIPVVLLARLAVDLGQQKQGIGRGLLMDAITRTVVIAEQVGIRALLTHPLDQSATQFYQHYGFESSPLHTNQLLLLLKDARKTLRNS